jgi:hypothetical protein
MTDRTTAGSRPSSGGASLQGGSWIVGPHKGEIEASANIAQNRIAAVIGLPEPADRPR